ncbi:hypothetical protein TNCV_1398731 [Trichonephila clavipes]|nr:hypothetical protein TNCV_1398731 [Trichonephila clavipes]
MSTSDTVRHKLKKQETKRKTAFIETVVEKCKVYNNCLKLRSLTAIQRRWSSWRTPFKMSGISRTRAAASDIRATRFHLRQVESHKQDSSHASIKSNRDSINQEIGVAK